MPGKEIIQLLIHRASLTARKLQIRLLSSTRFYYDRRMSITTTCIGAYPKPDYVEIGNFAETGAPDDGLTRAFSYTQDSSAEVPEELLLRATRAAIHDQIECGIDSTRLLAAPDCGLMMLGRELAMAKLHHMCAAAARI